MARTIPLISIIFIYMILISTGGHTPSEIAGINKKVYPHKFRISMITHMAEHPDCTINEIQAQSRHRDLSILLEYVQHTSKRIRNTYDKIFEREESIIPEIPKPEFEDADHYKKLAFKKYLDGDLDIHSLNNILSS